MTATSAGPVRLEAQGDVTAAEIEYARQKVEAALRDATRPVLYARVKLTRLADPARERPCVVTVSIDLDGKPVRAQASGPTMREAADEIRDRLRTRIHKQAAHWEAIRGNQPGSDPTEWRHGSTAREREG